MEYVLGNWNQFHIFMKMKQLLHYLVSTTDYTQLTSLMVSVWDIIWILTCDWLVGRLSLERDLTSCRE
jgi:hypothetical protein